MRTPVQKTPWVEDPIPTVDFEISSELTTTSPPMIPVFELSWRDDRGRSCEQAAIRPNMMIEKICSFLIKPPGFYPRRGFNASRRL